MSSSGFMLSKDVRIAAIAFFITFFFCFFPFDNLVPGFLFSGIYLGISKYSTRKSKLIFFILVYALFLFDDFFLKDEAIFPRKPYYVFVLVSIPFNALTAIIPVVLAFLTSKLTCKRVNF